jgi:hypothetical protein
MGSIALAALELRYLIGANSASPGSIGSIAKAAAAGPHV